MLRSVLRPPSRPSRRAAALSGAAALGLSGALVLGVGLSAGTGTAAAASPAPLVAATAPATTAPAVTTAPATLSASAVPSSPPAALWTPTSAVHLLVPAVGLDVPILPLTPRGKTIEPPTLSGGYWLSSFGSPENPERPAANTVYIAGHSWSQGPAAFNPLMTGGSRGKPVGAGDVVTVRTPGGSRTYRVTGTKRYPKGALPSADDVWSVVPGRLVLLTCFLDAQGRTTNDNLIVFAES